MPTPTPPLAELDDAACQRALAVLVDVGTSLALECKTPAPDASLAARTLAYERVAQAVRRAVILSQHIAAAGPARDAREAASEAARAQRRRQVVRAVEDSIQRNARPKDAEALRLELLERIDSPEFDEDLATRPPEQIIAELCRDLALANLPGRRPDRRRTPDDIAILCAQAAAPAGSGLPRWVATAVAANPDPDCSDPDCSDPDCNEDEPPPRPPFPRADKPVPRRH